MAKTVGNLQEQESIEIPIREECRADFGDYLKFTVVGSNVYCDNSKLMFMTSTWNMWAMDVSGVNFDAEEPKNPRESRRNFGNPIWSVSNIKGWLNSTEKKWYKPLHSYDQEPVSPYVETDSHNKGYSIFPGFLYLLDERVVKYIGDSQYKAAYDNSNGGYGVSMMTSKVFLPSTREAGLTDRAVNDGNTIPGLVTCLKKNAGTGISKRMSRTVDTTSDNLLLSITSGKTLISWANFRGKNIYECEPLLSMLNTLRLSDNKNSRGNYTIIFNESPTAPTGIVAPETCFSGRPLKISWGAATDPDGDSITYNLERSVNNAAYTQVTTTAALEYTESNISKEWNTLQYRVRAYDGTDYSSYITSGTIAVVHNRPPVLSGEDGDLGEKSINVSYRYTVTDPDGDSVSITETVDSKTLRTYTARLGEENELDISGDNFTALSIGTHTITITAKDAAGNTTTRTLTFTKTITGFSVTLREPLPADTMPTRCFVNVSREIPFGALFQVEACNNPNDTSPVWEDITAAVLASHVHVFANDTDHGLQHGFNIRVTVERKSDLGECWIGGIGGNFE